MTIFLQILNSTTNNLETTRKLTFFVKILSNDDEKRSRAQLCFNKEYKVYTTLFKKFTSRIYDQYIQIFARRSVIILDLLSILFPKDYMIGIRNALRRDQSVWF